MKPLKEKTLQVRITAQQFRLYQREAEKRGTTISEMIRQYFFRLYKRSEQSEKAA